MRISFKRIIRNVWLEITEHEARAAGTVGLGAGRARARVCVWEGGTSGWKNQLVVVKASLQPASLFLSLPPPPPPLASVAGVLYRGFSPTPS